MPRPEAAHPDDWDWLQLRRRCLGEARRLLPSDADAEEAVQEALLRAWRQRHRCWSPEAPAAWLLAITRNEALRVASRRAEALVPTAPEEPDLPAAEAYDAAAVRLDVRASLREFDEIDRALVWLRYGEDMTQPDAAQVLGLAEGTAKVRLHRLRQRLRVSLDP